MPATATISRWGNSQALRIPADILRRAGLRSGDTVFFEIQPDHTLVVAKQPSPEKGTLEYLFKDYDGGAFDTELTNPDTPVGNERW
ncbi:MAG: AbrB/MazE/SpoVT family DNA-binding domain-containing protein [Lachnospiraceae bacterium]|jgi:antitoxin MazE|nr:AbrB/MazE/SpoVT family DNA-binding domain-containing protein [Lachnospiraceae bacterium]